mmetsp:Transcript_30849/g.77966  ORF Transcript_30849/g.77966 Transcript_30849/m.77966 type:complete len:349 (+) Transcript_30849:270-1316(+)
MVDAPDLAHPVCWNREKLVRVILDALPELHGYPVGEVVLRDIDAHLRVSGPMDLRVRAGPNELLPSAAVAAVLQQQLHAVHRLLALDLKALLRMVLPLQGFHGGAPLELPRDHVAVEIAALHEVRPLHPDRLLLRALRHAPLERDARRHLEVEAVLGREVVVDVGPLGAARGVGRGVLALGGVPVAHDHAFEAHDRLEVSVEDIAVGTGVGCNPRALARRALHQVVGAHDRGDAGVDGRLERGVVDLEECALVHLLHDVVTIFLDGVRDEVLGGLQRRMWNPSVCRDHGTHHLGAKVRILAAHVLAQPPVPREARQVDARPELPAARDSELLGHLLRPELHQLYVPSG